MIISHKYKFIFIKTRKVAGTSIERILHPLLGDDDIHSKLPRESVLAKNCSQSIDEHVGWEWIADNYPQEWDSYYKFTIERNPWDKLASGYFYFQNFYPTDPPLYSEDAFLAWVLETDRTLFNDWTKYTNHNRLVVNQVIEYNSLHTAFAYLCKQLNIPYSGELEHVREKSGCRNFKGYRHLYTAAAQNRVAEQFDPIIRMFEYKF
jgi:hypothetical protein